MPPPGGHELQPFARWAQSPSLLHSPLQTFSSMLAQPRHYYSSHASTHAPLTARLTAYVCVLACLCRGKPAGKSAEEVELLKAAEAQVGGGGLEQQQAPRQHV